jgi:hypothetical protein
MLSPIVEQTSFSSSGNLSSAVGVSSEQFLSLLKTDHTHQSVESAIGGNSFEEEKDETKPPRIQRVKANTPRILSNSIIPATRSLSQSSRVSLNRREKDSVLRLISILREKSRFQRLWKVRQSRSRKPRVCRINGKRCGN